MRNVFFEASEFNIYLNENESNYKGVEQVANGNGKILKLNKLNFFKTMIDVSSIGGESVLIKTESLNDIIKKIDLQNITYSSIDGFEIVTGYSNRFKNYLLVKNKRVNIQIKFTGKEALVGHPLIMQGF